MSERHYLVQALVKRHEWAPSAETAMCPCISHLLFQEFLDHYDTLLRRDLLLESMTTVGLQYASELHQLKEVSLDVLSL